MQCPVAPLSPFAITVVDFPGEPQVELEQMFFNLFEPFATGSIFQVGHGVQCALEPPMRFSNVAAS